MLKILSELFCIVKKKKKMREKLSTLDSEVGTDCIFFTSEFSFKYSQDKTILAVMENPNTPYKLDANYEHVSMNLAKLEIGDMCFMSHFSGAPCFSVSKC